MAVLPLLMLEALQTTGVALAMPMLLSLVMLGAQAAETVVTLATLVGMIELATGTHFGMQHSLCLKSLTSI